MNKTIFLIKKPKVGGIKIIVPYSFVENEDFFPKMEESTGGRPY